MKYLTVKYIHIFLKKINTKNEFLWEIEKKITKTTTTKKKSV